jgi:helicase
MGMLVENMDDELVRVALQSWGITALTDVQEKALQAGLLIEKSLIVSAPTSSGKTLIAEIATLKAVDTGCRILYLVSHKALADQKFVDFENRFGKGLSSPLATVGLSTGDRSEGETDAQIRVATYEKAISLILSGQARPESSLVIADEFQIICDPTRGADIETLCTVFRERKVRQFIGLTATVENPGDLARWLGCVLVESTVRGTPLFQEIRDGSQRLKLKFGDSSPTTDIPSPAGTDLQMVVTELLGAGLGPVLVFAETRKEAADWASEFTRVRSTTSEGLAISAQLELFSEPTESSDKLRTSAERCVAFHTADLSAQERQVLEDGFTRSKFDVCFATSTLAAGVNYPFRTIVFPKLSYQHREVGERLSRSDYRNMSGRAGRLGLHSDGHAILLARNPMELAHAKKLIQPTNDVLKSVLLQLSIRKTVLSLIASRVLTSPSELEEFFRNTFYWHELVEKGTSSHSELFSKSRKAVDWLAANSLITAADQEFSVTALGRAAAISGLLPDTAVELAEVLSKNKDRLESNFDDLSDGLIYAACASKEFTAERPSRYLPYPAQGSFGGLAFWRGKLLPVKLDQANERLLQSSYAIALYVTGLAERKISRSAGLSAGMTQRFAYDVAWVLDGLHRISVVADLGLSQGVSNQISQLARRVRWGAPVETLDIIRTAEKHRVPGLGRQRAMELASRGWSTFKAVIGAKPSDLLEVLKHSLRVEAFIQSMGAAADANSESYRAAHIRIAGSLGFDEVMARCYSELGTDYESAIFELLSVKTGLTVTRVDDGKRQNVPDLLVKCGDLEALVECKTSAKKHGLVSKEDAWAILQKAADFSPDLSRVTLGKPGFDESAKSKVALSTDLTLVENEAFLEGILRLILKDIDSRAFMTWLCAPGLAEIERLPGRPSYNLR